MLDLAYFGYFLPVGLAASKVCLILLGPQKSELNYYKDVNFVLSRLTFSIPALKIAY